MAPPNGPPMHRIVVRGIKPEHSIDRIVDVLSRLVKEPPPVLQLLLDGRKTVFMRTTDMDRAMAYKRTLDTIGCICSIETEAPAPAAVSADDPAFTVNFATATIKPAAGREFQFAQSPTLREMLVNYLRANRITFGIAFVLLLYIGVRYFLSLG